MTHHQDLFETVKTANFDAAELPKLALELAKEILAAAKQEESLSEKYQNWKMARMMEDPAGKALTLALSDQVFRPRTDTRSADQFRYLVNGYGVPQYLPLHERIAMQLGAVVSNFAPDIVMPAITSKMRSESKKVILPSEDEELKPHIEKRRKTNTRLNINQLGEAILGEEEAAHRLQQVIDRLKSPDCDYISVKISAIFSQINLLSYGATLETIKDRLRALYRTAIENPHTDQQGNTKAKFVNLDMEEYRDLHLTCDAFKQVLMEPEFLKLKAGIVLQAYLPDSYEVQQDLTAWAKQRVSQSGSPIKIRLVKGANLAMESVEASIHDWEQAPYYTKLDVDANYKRMLQYACQDNNHEAVHLGIASHNIFELSYALLLRAHHGLEDKFEFEMLEGMANHQARALKHLSKDLLLYAPVVREQDFHSAISYLVRRLDENTTEENFLHDLFKMSYGGELWDKQSKMFLDAFERIPALHTGPNRTQNRNLPVAEDDSTTAFHNAADTDWSLRHNTQWIHDIIANNSVPADLSIPLQINGKLINTPATAQSVSPNQPDQTLYSYSLADESLVQQALDTAENARQAWEDLGLEQRAALLRKVSIEVEKERGNTIAIMNADAGKAIAEADAEISEAIDFANYYAQSLSWEGLYDGTSAKPIGTVLITPPWNFPYAIPLGGILSALIGGNTVIIKPAPETVLTAWAMVNHCWDAGIPKDVLQFVPCPDNEIGRSLVTDGRVNAVVLTGAYATGRMFQSWKPELNLLAETSGKNSLIITNAADPDLAIKDLVKSAFGHAGQKCSAASLAIIEADTYDDPAFMRQLRDAAASLKVGPSSDPSSIVTPIIRTPDHALKRALTTLDEGEKWLLEPQMIDGNPCVWSPGIKLDVKPESWYRRTECFGPVLGIIRARNLEHAIEIQNDSDFGLTGGIHTLDEREIATWRNRAQVGNAYINRSITGAIVQRQPFGGWKRSCFGPGAKAGGPNYALQFCHWTQDTLPTTGLPAPSATLSALAERLPEYAKSLEAAASSYQHWQAKEFSIEHDPTKLRGENNHFRYVPLKKLCLRADNFSPEQIALLLLAAATANVPVEISSANDLSLWSDLPNVSTIAEPETELIKRLPNSDYQCIRSLLPSSALLAGAQEAAIQHITWQPLENGRIELLHMHREQSISECTHRYGNIIPSPTDLAANTNA